MSRIKGFFKEDSNKIQGIKIVDIFDLYKTKKLQLEIIRKDEIKRFNVNIRSIDKENDQLHLACHDIKRDDFQIKDNDVIKLVYKYYRGILEWECSRIRDYKLEYLNIIVIEQKEKMKRINQREFFRINLRSDFKYDFEDKIIRAEMEDISYTGVKFNTEKKHEIDDVLMLYIDLLAEKVKIVRFIEKNDQNRFVYGAKFIDANESIEKYVNKKQLETIKNN